MCELGGVVKTGSAWSTRDQMPAFASPCWRELGADVYGTLQLSQTSGSVQLKGGPQHRSKAHPARPPSTSSSLPLPTLDSSSSPAASPMRISAPTGAMRASVATDANSARAPATTIVIIAAAGWCHVNRTGVQWVRWSVRGWCPPGSCGSDLHACGTGSGRARCTRARHGTGFARQECGHLDIL